MESRLGGGWRRRRRGGRRGAREREVEGRRGGWDGVADGRGREREAIGGWEGRVDVVERVVMVVGRGGDEVEVCCCSQLCLLSRARIGGVRVLLLLKWLVW